jgi:hypothetical protein
MPATYKLISSTTVGTGGAASISFTSIPQTYHSLRLVVQPVSENSTNLAINLTSGQNNGMALLADGYNSSGTTNATANGRGAFGNFISAGPIATTAGTLAIIDFYEYATTSTYKPVVSTLINSDAALSRFTIGQSLTQTAAITDIVVGNSNSYTITGTYTLYGVK